MRQSLYISHSSSKCQQCNFEIITRQCKVIKIKIKTSPVRNVLNDNADEYHETVNVVAAADNDDDVVVAADVVADDEAAVMIKMMLMLKLFLVDFEMLFVVGLY